MILTVLSFYVAHKVSTHFSMEGLVQKNADTLGVLTANQS
jgi:hypothetical protein